MNMNDGVKDVPEKPEGHTVSFLSFLFLGFWNLCNFWILIGLLRLYGLSFIVFFCFLYVYSFPIFSLPIQISLVLVFWIGKKVTFHLVNCISFIWISFLFLVILLCFVFPLSFLIIIPLS